MRETIAAAPRITVAETRRLFRLTFEFYAESITIIHDLSCVSDPVFVFDTEGAEAQDRATFACT